MSRFWKKDVSLDFDVEHPGGGLKAKEYVSAK